MAQAESGAPSGPRTRTSSSRPDVGGAPPFNARARGLSVWLMTWRLSRPRRVSQFIRRVLGPECVVPMSANWFFATIRVCNPHPKQGVCGDGVVSRSPTHVAPPSS